MSEPGLIGSLAVMVVAAAAMVLISRLIHVPSLVAYIFTGLLIGPGLGILAFSFEVPGDGVEAAAQAIHVIGEVGIALLLFLVGLELSLERIRDVGRVAVLAGLGQVVFTAAGGFALSLALDFTVMESLFLAIALTFSSTVVVVKLLDQKKELHSLYGRIAVGIFLVQDLVVIVALTFLAGLGNPEEVEAMRLTWNLAWAFVGMGALLLVSLLASKHLLPRPFTWASPSGETLFIWSLGWCFLFVVMAELFGLSREIGAFLAGISLAQLGCSHDLVRRVRPLVNFFVAIFFISLGAQMRLEAALDLWFPAAVLSLFVLIGNPFIFLWIIGRSGYGERTSFLTSVTVAQISEFSFIFAAVGLDSGLIDESILSLVALVGLVTIAVSAYMILYNHWLYEKTRKLGLLRLFRLRRKDDEEARVPLEEHVVVVGINTLGRRLVEELHNRKLTVLAIDTDARKLKGLRSLTHVGNVDYLSVLEDVFVPSARLAVSALQIEDTNNVFAYRCKSFGVPVAVHAFDRSVIEGLRALEVDYLIDSKNFGVSAILKEAGLASQLEDEGGPTGTGSTGSSSP